MKKLIIDTSDYPLYHKEIIEEVKNNPRHCCLEVKEEIEQILAMLVMEAEESLGRFYFIKK